MTMLEWALKYAEKNCAVFPLRERSKAPATEHGFYDATTDESQIRKWWEENPNYNIGIATGEVSHGLYVIDIDDDPKKNKHGSESLRQWEAVHGSLPVTLTAVSGTGGHHYYYRTRDTYQKAEDVGGLKHIDVRANGGYIVAPPSIHPDTGEPYRWMPGLGIDDRPPAMLSGSAKALADEGVKEKPRDYTPQPLDTVFAEGTRTKALVSVIGSLIRKGFTEEEIRKMIGFVNESRCSPPLTDKELEREVFPAFKRNWKVEAPFWNDDFSEGDLPDPVLLGNILSDPPPLAPVLIEGVLRQGHKMSLTGPSKAGKSFALMELAVAISEGMKWFGNSCEEGKVLYINMEIDSASCFNRFQNIYEGLHLNIGTSPSPKANNIHVWGLRGKSMPLSTLTPYIIEMARGRGYKAILIDPLYKVMDGDENSNSEVGRMVTCFDQIAGATGASVIYAHHFAKGAAGDKSVIDRGSGAGAFARDPDAIVTMTQIDQPDEVNRVHTAWRVEFVLRDFPNKEPYDIWWEYPLHVYDTDRLLEDAEIESAATRSARQKNRVSNAKKNKRIEAVREAAEAVMVNGEFSITDFIDSYSFETVSKNTAKERLKEAGYRLKPGATGRGSKWIRTESVKLSKMG